MKKVLLLATAVSSGFVFDSCNLDFGGGKGLAIIGGLVVVGALLGFLSSATTTST